MIVSHGSIASVRVPVRSRPNDQTVPILVSTGNATDRPAPRRRVSRRRVVAHSAGTGWRANDPTYRRGAACSLPVSRAMISACLRFKAATQKSSCFFWLEIVLALRRLSKMAQGPALRCGPPNVGSPSTPDTTSDRIRPTPPRPAPKKPVMAYPAKPRRGPRRTVTTTTRHAHSDGIGGKIGSER